jgi:lipid-A-disaccharide synthase
LNALRAKGAEFEAHGIGGPELRDAGLRVVAPMESIAVMGFAEVITHLGAIRRARDGVRRLLEREPDGLFLPIDAPGMNLGLARDARLLGRRVVYYVCPQIWAWGYGRVARLREDVDRTLLLFKFEEEILRRERANATWVGHPAGALHPDAAAHGAARASFGLGTGERLLALLPGSRRGEVHLHLAPMLDAAARLATAGGLRVVVSDAGNVEEAKRGADVSALWASVAPATHRGPSEALLRAADLALVASGTATLETAALGVPLVLVYRTGRINFAIARRLVKVRRIGLVNIVLDEDVVPECVQGGATGAAIAAAAAPLLTNESARERQLAAFARLPGILGGAGSAARAADAILEVLAAPQGAVAAR